MRRPLRKVLPDHLRHEVPQGDGQEVLPTHPEGLRRNRSDDLQGGLRDVLHDEVRAQAERDQARRRDQLREDSGQSLRTRS